MASNPQSTHQDPFSNQDNNGGYATDQSQNRRRSSRASSLVVIPNMVATASDSRVRLTRPALTNTNNKKRPASAAPSSDSESNPSLQIQSTEFDDESVQNGSAAAEKKKKNKKKKKCNRTPAQKKQKNLSSKKKSKSKKPLSPENGQESGPASNYEQDTDSGSIVIRPRGEKIKKLGKSDRGCVNRKKAKQAGVKLPPSVAERQKMETNVNGETKQIGISGFLQVQHPFDNGVLNQLVHLSTPYFYSI
ncbi:hypothetical protein PCANC_24409 [Puccinia coronata f. sp. avenae]|uniref:Uncharacterized protein n=1 Tax=Puccinia coronata f. sp. avenae TaxID=200324 RepID=A0A2N5V591_9BASI|nr:hypothetical protein PCANC_24409 [Puccinia coronata f. sp. avenae]PLW45162.1 hypothetical protein PCASD_04546 [Puccinia coronata f. sp. avenae]